MGRRNDHSRAEIRELAIQAAATLIAEQGLTGLSARKVAAAIGYTVGSLYLIFHNLDELIIAVNARTLDQLAAAMEAEIARCAEPEACLLNLAQCYLQFAVEHTPSWRAIFEFRAFSEERDLPDWFQTKIAALFALVEQPLQGLLPASADSAQSARALWGGVHGICILAISGKLDAVQVDAVEPLLHLLVSNYLRGLRQG